MHLPSLLLAAGSASFVLTSPLSRVEQRASKLQFIGVNESGPEFGNQNLPGTYGTDYTWPTQSTITTLHSKGMNTFRVNILMERIIPNKMTGPLDSAYLGNLTQTVDQITSIGAYAIIVPHNYGRYYNNIITSTSDFGAFWKTLAGQFKSNSKVIFDVNNECNAFDKAEWVNVLADTEAL